MIFYLFRDLGPRYRIPYWMLNHSFFDTPLKKRFHSTPLKKNKIKKNREFRQRRIKV